MSMYFSNRAEAFDMIERWTADCEKLIANPNAAITGLYTNKSAMRGETDRTCSAVLAKCILSMYVAADEPSPQERMAAAIEKTLKDGEEWKSE